MKWQGRRQSSNVDDRRRSGGGGGAVKIGGAGMLIVLVISLLFGGPQAALDSLNKMGGGAPPQTEYVETERDKELAEFVSVVLADTEDVWHAQFKELGREYVEPKLVLYRDYVSSACGSTSSAVGPFYCSADQSVYIDLGFFDELESKFGASGDFAIAYVVSHEVGHHVQTLLGITEQLHDLRQKLPQEEYNKYSVRFELQADYLSGVWANGVKEKGYLEVGDIDEAVRAAQAVGDDAIQKAARGYVVPDSFTHGTSEQRAKWFKLGYKTGNLDNWNTFEADI